jgi:hypothetical protein
VGLSCSHSYVGKNFVRKLAQVGEAMYHCRVNQSNN